MKHLIYMKGDRVVVATFAECAVIDDEIAKCVPSGTEYFVVASEDLPECGIFFNALAIDKSVDVARVYVDLDKAKPLAHELRRAAREKEFEPFDNIIAKKIPGQSAELAEAERAIIRKKYQEIQRGIDVAKSDEEIERILFDACPDMLNGSRFKI